MEVNPATAASSVSYAGEIYYFRSKGCAAKFRATPEEYLKTRAKGPSSDHSKTDLETEYTCPMHPEIKQKGPGSCPKCGMALEPTTIAAPTARTEYTCPVHPEIVRSEPGSCPICGMDSDRAKSRGKRSIPNWPICRVGFGSASLSRRRCSP